VGRHLAAWRPLIGTVGPSTTSPGSTRGRMHGPGSSPLQDHRRTDTSHVARSGRPSVSCLTPVEAGRGCRDGVGRPSGHQRSGPRSSSHGPGRRPHRDSRTGRGIGRSGGVTSVAPVHGQRSRRPFTMTSGGAPGDRRPANPRPGDEDGPTGSGDGTTGRSGPVGPLPDASAPERPDSRHPGGSPGTARCVLAPFPLEFGGEAEGVAQDTGVPTPRWVAGDRPTVGRPEIATVCPGEGGVPGGRVSVRSTPDRTARPVTSLPPTSPTPESSPARPRYPAGAECRRARITHQLDSMPELEPGQR
jgi:hypothetical protein